MLRYFSKKENIKIFK